MRLHSNQAEGEYDRVLVLSNCILTAAHTKDILGLYLN